MGAAILCPPVCISDVINEAGMCGKNIKYVTSQTFIFGCCWFVFSFCFLFVFWLVFRFSFVFVFCDVM